MIEVDASVLKQVNESFIIPPKPEILTEIQEISESSEPSLADTAVAIAKDVGLSAAILKVINSPAYGLARSVSDIRQAVMFLGWDGIRALVQGLKLKEAFATNKSCISLERFWDTASEIADVAMFIGKLVKSKVPIENLYTLGLFHDCGVPPMAIKYADYVDVLRESNNNFEQNIVELEEMAYKTNHAVVGYFLATAWHLPKDICQLILLHHDKAFLSKLDGGQDQICFAVLKLAENLVNLERRHSNTSDWYHVKSDVLDVLGLSEEDYNDLKDDISDHLVAA